MESNPYYPLFESLRNHQFHMANTHAKGRIKKLDSLKRAIEVNYRESLKQALYKEFKKPYTEIELTEIFPVISEIKHTRKHLASWMKKQRVDTPLALLGSSSYYIHEPKGVCLIIAPWNYPINLVLSPLISAIAAGNTVVIKPSEYTPKINKVLKDVIEYVFTENEVVLIEGGVETSTHLLNLPFNHIHFTGSPKVGKIVMQKAATHLSSVTLELGGKSPLIVDETADLVNASKKIAWSKFINGGQICISPDYLWVHESVKDSLLELIKKQVSAYYSKHPHESPSYCRIINNTQFQRLKNYIETSVSQGSIIEMGGHFNDLDCYISPTIISNIAENHSLFTEEIFGPILPVKTFKTLDEVTTTLQSLEKPLALYVFSQSKKNQEFVLNNTRAGSSCINTTIVQYSNPHLPFGGSNHSGIGKSHGAFGFAEFSNQRSVVKQFWKGFLPIFYPPYSPIKEKLAKLVVRWL